VKERKEIYYMAQDPQWEEAEEALSPSSAIFSHLQGTVMSFSFKKIKN
jgi:hypothetical protein